MNTQEIARHLLNRRNTMNPVIYPGEMVGAIGSEAMQEALQRRWLIPSEMGLLQITPEMLRVEEMRQFADKCPTCGNADCTCGVKATENVSHKFAFEHAMRRPGSGSPLYELLSPGTGHENDSGLKATAPGAPQPPVPLTPSTPPKPRVGEDGKPLGVATAKDGKLEVTLDKSNPQSQAIASQVSATR